MKYWENNKGEFGTMEDKDMLYPPGFKTTSKKKYDNYVSAYIALKPDPKMSDLEKLIIWAESKGFKR